MLFEDFFFLFWAVAVIFLHARLVQPGPIYFRTTFTCPGTSLKKVNTILYLKLDNYDELTCCVENIVDPDQLASEEAS